MQLILAAAALAADFSGQEDPVQPAFTVHADGFPTTGLEGAVQAALRTWNIQGRAAMEVRYGGTGGAGDEGAGDGASTIDVGTGTGGGPWAAFLRDSGEDRLECDIRLLSSNDNGAQAWSTTEAGTPDAWDAEAVVLQTIGLCLGLPLATGDTVMAPLSKGTGPERRVLGPNDPAALQALYGVAAVNLVPWSHFVIYDAEGGEDADGRGAPGETVVLRLQVLNEGTPAYDVSGHAVFVGSSATITFTEPDATHGDIAPGDFGIFVFDFVIDDCDPGSTDVITRVDLTDARGDVYPIDVEFPLQCAGEDLDTGNDDEPRCGCATGPTSGWLAAAVVAASLRRRQRR